MPEVKVSLALHLLLSLMEFRNFRHFRSFLILAHLLSQALVTDLELYKGILDAFVI
jgi:hypothetical protein